MGRLSLLKYLNHVKNYKVEIFTTRGDDNWELFPHRTSSMSELPYKITRLQKDSVEGFLSLIMLLSFFGVCMILYPGRISALRLNSFNNVIFCRND
jgi:hypothetical protein